MNARKSTILAFQFVKPILQTITYLIQYTVLENQFWSVKCTAVEYEKISSISIPSHQTISNAIFSTTYLFKLYSISIILLL